MEQTGRMNASLLTNFLRQKWHIEEPFLPWTESAKRLNHSFNHPGAPVPPAAEPCRSPEAIHLHVEGGWRSGKEGDGQQSTSLAVWRFVMQASESGEVNSLEIPG